MREQVLKPEVMAPAGSFESLQAAINAGADSVFFGVQQLNMRARAAQHFTIEDMQEIAARCKKAGVKSYITLNTLLYEHDMNLMHQIVNAAKEAGIDAVIVQDIAAIEYCREIGMPIQCSTQLSISNYQSVKFYANFADTIVLARELDLQQIKHICEQIRHDDLRGPSGETVRIEVFVHGALCVAQSGRCHMSVLQTNTSAQRGACLQECRKKYRIIEEETGQELVLDNHYVMSPKDLCALPFLDQVADTGAAVFKIEGRGRSPEYVDMVVRVYREAVDRLANNTFTQEFIDQGMERLKKVFNRGFCDGYFYGKTFADWTGTDGSQASEEKIYAGLINHYFPRAKAAEVDVRAHQLKVGDKVVIMGKTTGVVHTKIDQMMRDKQLIESSNSQDIVTVRLHQKVRNNDKVYILRNKKVRENA